ncbi:MAG: M14 family metallopeptidase, partial [Acidobacteriota bacterium]|nr:M14 family metallopeptidase [Acidobacteriota bacterium]
SNPLTAEHNEPWPGGRTNHYYFDMNRDWFAMTQPETIARSKVVQQWYPLVFVDLHEMGSDSTYYFAPESNPYNPHILKRQRESLEWFGRNNAHWIDQYGYRYFTREAYDEFYPGYGASWPLYYGSIAMTYEQASTRGLVVRRSDGMIVNYRDTVRQHFVASISTAETTARNRDKLLANFFRYRQTAIDEGSREPIREYILPRVGNTSAVDKLAGNLASQGIELKRATAAFQNAGKPYATGSYVVSLAQPSKRLIRTLLDTQTSMEPEFLQSEERRRQARQPTEMYDVTAWSLPLQYGIAAITSAEVSKGSFEPVPAGFRPEGRITGSNASVAYLVPWSIGASARFLSAALLENLRIATSDRAFKQDGRTFPSGSLIVKVKENGPDLADVMARLAKSSGADVFTTDSGWVDEGPNFGSHRVFYFPRIKIALAWDRPTGASAAGATRYVLERQYGYPVSVVRTAQLATGDLSQFQVIILPDSGFGEGYDAVLGPGAARRLKDWVQAGGTLIGLGSGAVSYLADSRTSLLAISQENVAKDSTEKKPSETSPPAVPSGGASPAASPRVPGKLIGSEQEFAKSIQPDSELPDSLHGVLLRAQVNQDHWVTAGVPEIVNVLTTGRAIYTPIKLDKGVNAAYFAGPDQLMASGYMWEQNRKQLAYKPFVVVQREGRGNVVGFTADPNFRGYMDGLNMLFLNAVFRGPAHAGSALSGGE